MANGGTVYADNPRFIMEELVRLQAESELVWIGYRKNGMTVPSGIKLHNLDNYLRRMYDYSTAKVLITTTGYPICLKKRKGQIVINTWHGALGLKWIGKDNCGEWDKYDRRYKEYNNNLSDVFISNSNYLSGLYRNAFGYSGPIWKCGYPRNDMFMDDKTPYRARVRQILELAKDVKILLYAPTFRDYASDEDILECYAVDFAGLKNGLTHKFGGEWAILVRLHPRTNRQILQHQIFSDTIDVTKYGDIQELMMASDVVMSDYSSCIFEAAAMSVDCMLFANDFERYKAERGVYFDLNELPFPYAESNAGLMQMIDDYDRGIFLEKWKVFANSTGLHETGHASNDIALKIIDFLNGKKVVWENTDL